MTSRWLKTIGEVILINLAIAILITLLIVWLGANPRQDLIKWYFVYSLIYSNCIGTLCAITLTWLAPRVWRQSPFFRWSAIIAALLACAWVGLLISLSLIFVLKINYMASFWDLFNRNFRGAALITLLIGLIVTIYEGYRYRIERANLELKNKQIEHERALKLASEAHLASIESRIQPHFLFNTLNSISSLIREDPERAEHLIGRLSTLLRNTLDTHAGGLVPLEREFKLVGDYLEIQKARFGDRLRYSLDLPTQLAASCVPPFSVQTLVENSVKYAVAPRREGALIQVAARQNDGRLWVEVTDDGPGFDGASLKPGHGLDSLNARLAAMFGDQAALDITPLHPGSSVTLSIPA